MSEEYPFGATLDEMDVEAFFNIREWLRGALQEAGAKIEGGGVGMGQADLDFSIDGAPFNVSVRPRVIPKA